MKIAPITETYPPEVNGVATTNQRLVRGLIGLGHKVLLIKPRRPEAQTRPKKALTTPECMGIPIPNYSELKIGILALDQLEHAFEGYCPDVVHIATRGSLRIVWTQCGSPTGYPRNFNLSHKFTRLLCRLQGRIYWQDDASLPALIPEQVRGADTKLFTPEKRSDDLRHNWARTRTHP